MKMDMKKENIKSKILTVSNGITTLRIIGSVALVFLGYTSPLFIVIYTLTGLTDVLDGWIARLTGTAGKFGATLDSIADLLFYTVMTVKFLPVLLKTLPVEIWYGVTVVLLIRLSAYTTTAIKYHSFASLHTILNKLTGGAVFLMPYAVFLSWERVYGWIVVAIAFIASSEELIIHLSRKSYCADVKTIFNKQ